MIGYLLGGFGAGIVIGIALMWWTNIRHRRTPSLTKYVVFSIAILIIYTAIEFAVSTITGVSHDTLTTCVYGCFGGEILSCALIKIFKLKEENKDE